MKRLVICYDGTWNAIARPEEVTNIVRVAQAVHSVSSKGVAQVVYYNAGVGSGGRLDRVLGGVFGAGLRDNVKRGLAFLSLNWDPSDAAHPDADEIYIFGFSRGAYTARALAGVIGAIGGIPKQSSFEELENIWTYYQTKDEKLKKQIPNWLYPMANDNKPLIKCVGVWDTVGSYGVPSGLGLSGLALNATAWTHGFHDNELGKQVEYGLHAMAIDERRRAFPPTTWVTDQPQGRPGVEQVWFAGVHSNVGGGYLHTGLSDLALIWMLARVRDLTGLEFDEDYIAEHFWPCAACSLYTSSRGWILSNIRPFVRQVLSAAGTTVMEERTGKKQKRVLRPINEKVHWSVMERVSKLAIVDDTKHRIYAPRNLPKAVTEVVEHTKREDHFIDLCRKHPNNERHQKCALSCSLPDQKRRARRLRRLREIWEVPVQ
jgi:uncharacterized protein (DUF2235 family)